ncbi:AAA family ATPase [Nitriliruptoraceae bacterium ZYF776]|nr:AAA family ATPase [Profundirhabdus halotolerans]
MSAPSRHDLVVVVDPQLGLATTVESLLHREANVEVRRVDTLDEAFQLLTVSGVLVAGPSLANKRGVAALQQVHRRTPAVRVLLAFDKRTGASVAEVVAIGADALVDPSQTNELRAGLDRVLRISRELVPLGSLTETEPTSGMLVTVTSATGGCGKTFVATSLATAMAAWGGVRVALVDLDLQFGEIVASLGIRSRSGWGDLVGVAPDQVGEFVGAAIVSHESGVDVLAAPTDPAAADLLGGELIGAVLDELRRTYDVVVVDTSTGLSEATLTAVDRTDELIVMSLLDIASIRNLRTMDRTLDRLGVDREMRRLVLNKDRTGVGLTAEEVERALERTFVARIPYSEEVLRSMNGGRSVPLDLPAAELLAPLMDLVLAVAPADRRAELETHRPEVKRRRFALPWRRRDVVADVTT